MSNAKLTPDYLFEVSWEVCNKVGGIHTVISTKAQTVTRKFADRYILIGPDLQHEGANPEFEEDPDMLKAWRQSVYSDGLRIRVGHWKIKGKPTVILVDFTSLIPAKTKYSRNSGRRTTWIRSRDSGTTSSPCSSAMPRAWSSPRMSTTSVTRRTRSPRISTSG